MAGLNVKLQGFDELKKRLEQAIKKVPAEVDAELEAASQQMREGAIRDAPADQGILRAEIQSAKLSFLNHGIFSNALYSGYMEFGTKSNVEIPPGLEDVASELQGKSVGSLNAKEAIFQWCKRKGIDPKLWYPIFIKIMVQGIKPHPFFFRQIDVAGPQLIKNVQNIIGQI